MNNRTTSRIALALTVGLVAILLAGCGAASSQKAETTSSTSGQGAARESLAAVTYIQPCEGDPVHKPETLAQACDDFTAVLRDLHWEHWGEAEAEATGRIDRPDGAGNTSSYAVTVVASDLTLGEASAHYKTLTITPRGNAPTTAPPRLIWHF